MTQLFMTLFLANDSVIMGRREYNLFLSFLQLYEEKKTKTIVILKIRESNDIIKKRKK